MKDSVHSSSVLRLSSSISRVYRLLLQRRRHKVQLQRYLFADVGHKRHVWDRKIIIGTFNHRRCFPDQSVGGFSLRRGLEHHWLCGIANGQVAGNLEVIGLAQSGGPTQSADRGWLERN